MSIISQGIRKQQFISIGFKPIIRAIPSQNVRLLPQTTISGLLAKLGTEKPSWGQPHLSPESLGRSQAAHLLPSQGNPKQAHEGHLEIPSACHPSTSEHQPSDPTLTPYCLWCWAFSLDKAHDMC